MDLSRPLIGVTGNILQRPLFIADILTAVLILAIGVAVAIVASRLVSGLLTRKTSLQLSQVIRRFIFYVILVIVVLIVLGTLGVSVAGLLAAAGIVGLAVAFASQSAISNLISGLFLIGERPFQVGDVVRVGTTTGIVMEIGLVSTKLRTFDNLYVRIPNEDLLKTDITTITRYELRRMDVVVSVAYKEYLPRARALLMKIAQEHPLVLVEPEPLALITKLGDSGIDIIVRVWFYKPNYIALLNDLTERIKTGLDEAGIEIPFPHVKLYFDEEALATMKPPL